MLGEYPCVLVAPGIEGGDNMAYRYTVSVEARGRGYREAKVTAKDDRELKRVCNALLEYGTKVTILKKTRIKARNKK